MGSERVRRGRITVRRQTIAAALHRELDGTHRAVKTTMRWTGASERTAKNWIAGSHGPSGEHLISLLRHSDEVLMRGIYADADDYVDETVLRHAVRIAHYLYPQAYLSAASAVLLAPTRDGRLYISGPRSQRTRIPLRAACDQSNE